MEPRSLNTGPPDALQCQRPSRVAAAYWKNATNQGKSQCNGVICDLVKAIVGNVRYDHAVLIRSLDVNNVNADPIPTYGLAAL